MKRWSALILLPVLASSQPHPDLKFDHLSLKDGLSNFTVTAIAQDHDGYLWFGTEDGLNRYNGYTFQQFVFEPSDSIGLPSPKVTSLCVDRHGRIWIGTQGGLVVHDPRTGTFARRTLPGTRASNISALGEDANGVMWIGTTGGTFTSDSSSDAFRKVPALGQKYVRCFLRYSGGMWIGTNADGLMRCTLHQDPDASYRSVQGDTLSLLSDVIMALAHDDGGGLWVGTSSGVCRMDTAGRFHRFTRLLESDPIYDLLVDHRGTLWVGTLSIGLRRYDRQRGQFLRIEHEEGNPHSLDRTRIQRLFEDAGGLLWVSTYRGGLNRYDPGRDQFINIRPAPPGKPGLRAGPVYAILEDKPGDVWIGTVGGGLNRYNVSTGVFTVYNRLRKKGPTVRPASPEDTVETEAILSLYEDAAGGLWVGTADALYLYHRTPGTFEPFPAPRLPDAPRFQGNVKCIGEDAAGNIWIGTHGGGVHRFDRATKTFHTYITDPQNPRSLSGMIVWAVRRDVDGAMWFGTFGAGICRYDPATDDFTRFPEDRGTLVSSGMASVYCIANGPDSALWIGTFAGGLHRFDRTTHAVTTFLRKDGLPNNFVKAVLPDDNGFLWLSTDLGIARFDPRTRTFRNYTQEDGLHDNVFLSGAYHRGRSGRLYFGGENGLTMFTPDSIRENRHRPTIVIVGVQVFDKPYAQAGTGWMKAGATLRYDQNFLQFEFAALDFANPSRQQYAYIMEGFDRQWIRPGNRRFARYTNLPPGQYTFRVRGTNNHGLWNEEGTSLAITITPPFWDRWWFRTLGLGLIVGGLWTAYRYRVNKLLELERLRVRIASDLHDEVGSSLTKISLQSELIMEGIDAGERENYLSNIASMSRELVTTMGDIVWSIDTRNDTWGSLLEKIRDSALGMLSIRGIELAFSHSGLDQKKKIGVETRENLYLVCKEAVNNAAKYSGARTVRIVLRNDDDKFTMVISDDGRGLPQQPGERRGSGHGLRNMTMRAERLGGTVGFVNDNGLTVVLTTKPV